MKLKQSGRLLRGDIFTRNANCNSACPYLLRGATSREVAPDALQAGHTADGKRLARAARFCTEGLVGAHASAVK